MTFDDFHVHTSLSYCAGDPITPLDYAEAVAQGRLRRAAITNHGFALHFPEELAWSWRFMTEPAIFDEYREWGNRRIRPHLDEVEALRDRGLLTGMEVEMMDDGRLTVDPEIRKRLEVLVGSVHWLPVDGLGEPRIVKAWMRHTKDLVRTGIDILGHPLRWLATQVAVPPREATDFVVETAREAGVALEINSHYVVDGDRDLLLAAKANDLPIVFSTDSHAFAEIARFDYHLRLLAEAGLRPEDLRFWEPRPRAGSPAPGIAFRCRPSF
jgi:histidinol phosphatase-like PHP family hydrolase